MNKQPEEGKASVKKLSDYLHLYLGCEMERSDVSGTFTLTAHTLSQMNLPGTYAYITQAKPILRPLPDMTEDELQECGNLVYDFSDDDSGLDLNNHRPDDFLLTTSEQFHWLIQRHFDVFGLIESNLALDKTKLTNHV